MKNGEVRIENLTVLLFYSNVFILHSSFFILHFLVSVPVNSAIDTSLIRSLCRASSRSAARL
jgi:hypothetical protein